MGGIGRSFKTPLFLSPVASRRPGMAGRTFSNPSNTSEASSTASSPGDVPAEDIVFSAMSSPTLPTSPRMVPVRRPDVHLRFPDSNQASPSSSSRPIAIDLPAPKKSISCGSAVVYTPPAPLSARGDLPGGYFPLHEEQNRVYRSHPFHLDASKARQKSIQRASETSSPDPVAVPPDPRQALLPPQPLQEGSYFQPSSPAAMSSSMAEQTSVASSSVDRSTTPITSYIPSGVHASPLPMGKYYPSNYENRKPEDHPQHSQRPSVSNSIPASVRSEPQVPMYQGDSSMRTSRNESEAKRRLQQYQRDMIAQATLALNGGNVNTAALNAISLRNIGFTSLSSKPSKPIIAPLGSPGPVTPMDLESNDDGYLGVRVPTSQDDPRMEEVTRAIRAEEERRRREGTSSPALDLSPVC